jgi:cytochrome c oxidase assembly protein subunit 15
LVFLLPFLYFLIRGRIHRPMVPKLVVMFVLGGLQGLLGWYMVKSGLVSRPHVSQYRLTAHLVAAFTIYAYILWVAMGLLTPHAVNAAVPRVGALRRLAKFLTGAVALVVISGGFVAGTKAGFAFNTFPLMNGHFVPLGYLALQPWWSNFFDNIATVQFDHRWLAISLATFVIGAWLYARRFEVARRTRIVLNLLLAMILLQVTLGITTLLFVVPVPLAAAHQAGALMLFTIALVLNHELRAG